MQLWWCEWLWHCCRCITFLQLADPLHQGVQRALGLQPVGGCGVGQHALLLLQVADFLQELFLQLPKPTLQEVTELTGERGAGYVGPHLLLLTKGGQDKRRRKSTEIIRPSWNLQCVTSHSSKLSLFCLTDWQEIFGSLQCWSMCEVLVLHSLFDDFILCVKLAVEINKLYVPLI